MQKMLETTSSVEPRKAILSGLVIQEKNYGTGMSCLQQERLELAGVTVFLDL